MFFQNLTGTRFGYVPYRGGGPAMQDLVAGQIDMMVDAPATVVPQLRAGTIKVYALAAKSRLASAPNVPDHRRSRAARIPFLGVVCVLRAQGHAEADGRPPQRRGG